LRGKWGWLKATHLKLRRRFSRLDEINSTLNSSERHLNGIKSVFGGIRNYLFAKRNGITTTASPSVPASSSAVQPIQNETSRPQMFTGNGQSSLDNYHPGKITILLYLSFLLWYLPDKESSIRIRLPTRSISWCLLI
jgi:hypothetical protein